MNEWTIFFMAAIVSILSLFAIFTVVFRPQHLKSEVLENSSDLNSIVEYYAETSLFRIHHVNDLEKPYCEITYMVSYKRHFKNLHELEEISRELLYIDYYVKL